MTVEKFQIEQILKTLPIGYYAKRNIEMSLDEKAECSCYDPMNDKILVSFKQLQPVLSELKDESNLENDIRTMLYHEVSHAILTPRYFGTVTKELNIFEDERIETLLKNYYMNVNFKDFVKRLNNFHGESPKTAHEAFYQTVRYRVGKQKWLDKVSSIIKTYSSLNNATTSLYKIEAYRDTIYQFYKEFCKEWEEEHKDSIKNSSESSANNSTTSKEEANRGMKTSGLGSEQVDVELKKIIESIPKSVEAVFNEFVKEDILSKVNEIFAKVMNVTKRNSSAINAYSGVFDPRSVSRDDYKYFTQKNRMGHLKTHSKVHMNLFIDRSGSFWSSENKVNCLLYALSKFEKLNPDFSFDLITIGINTQVHDKNDRQLQCGGGNRVLDETVEISKKMQRPDATNYNLVLFDGDAVSDSYINREQERSNFRAFNGPNFSIISDESNATTIRRFCKSSKVTITKDYADELIKSVFTTLSQMVR